MFVLSKVSCFKLLNVNALKKSINIRSYLRKGKLVTSSIRKIKTANKSKLLTPVNKSKLLTPVKKRKLDYFNTEYKSKLTATGKEDINNWGKTLNNMNNKTTDWDDSVSVLDYIKEDIKKNPNSFRAVSHENKVMSMMTVEEDKINKCLKVRNLLSNPERLTNNNSSGAGITSIVHLIEESINLGYNGKLKLTSLPKATTFYEKLGFKRVGSEFHFQYELDSIKAQTLMDNHLNSVFSVNELNSFSKYGEAVELEKGIVAFAITKKPLSN